MLKTTLGQLLINKQLPEDLRDYERVLDKKGVGNLMLQLAERYPERYRTIAKDISDVGRHAAYTTGGHSFGLDALTPTFAAQKMRLELGKKLEAIYSNRNIDNDERDLQITEAILPYQKALPDSVAAEATSGDNPLARQLNGAGRGNKSSLSSLLGADLLYADHAGHPVPIPVLRNYSEGLTPLEYFAGSYGTRKGLMDLKTATQDAGFFAKQLVQAGHRLIVTHRDDDNPYDEASPRGLPVPTNDADNAGGLLAHPVGGYKRNTELTPKILKDLSARGIDNILVRSPMIGGPEDGGVYGHDVGRRERGASSPIGDYVGVAAAQALAEPVTQAQISSKHSGGVAGAGAGAISGFKYINQLVQVPKTFRGGAAHAQTDGRVQSIEKAPQGGTYVTVGGKQHYMAKDYAPTVKVGDEVEAGDTISEGTPNPAEIVKHKGIGEGRQYFVQAFRKALEDSNTYGNRRNIELLSRGLINHVRLTDEVGDWSPDDVVPYQSIERSWKPRPGAVTGNPQAMIGKYLEKPVLHYSVGQKIRPSMVAPLTQYGVNAITVHADPPPFEPEMIRGMANVAHDPDWMARMLGSYQQKSLLSAVHRGAVADEAGTSYVPALAGSTTFGLSGHTKGWKSTPAPISPPAPTLPKPIERTRVIDMDNSVL